jgi:hypothetical protein
MRGLMRFLSFLLLIIILLAGWIFVQSQPLERHIVKVRNSDSKESSSVYYQWHPERVCEYIEKLLYQARDILRLGQKRLFKNKK